VSLLLRAGTTRQATNKVRLLRGPWPTRVKGSVPLGVARPQLVDGDKPTIGADLGGSPGSLSLPAPDLLRRHANQAPILGADLACKTGNVCHDEVREAAHHLARLSADGQFTIEAVVAELRRRGCTHRESTIRTHVTSRMCINAPDHHPVVYPDLRRVGVGVYCLAGRDELT